MEENNYISLCRICLQTGATIPIFDSEESNQNIASSIQWKLAMCLNEKIDDIEGYPRNICNLCHITLNTVCNFIKKYKESNVLLENSLKFPIKQEFVDFNDYCDIGDSEIDIFTDKSKLTDFEDKKHFIELVPPLQLKLDPKIKKEQKRACKSPRSNNKNNTNRIASSILEGNFVWTGEKWCIKSSKYSIKKDIELKASPLQKQKGRRKILNVPKAPKSAEPAVRLCHVCGQVFNTQDKLKNHILKIHKEACAECRTCSKKFSSEYYLKRHTRRQHNVAEKKFVCSQCGKQFAFEGEMRTHYKRVHVEGKKKNAYPCKLCDKTYACQKSVLIHVRSVHTGERPAECSVCGSAFYHEDYLKEHMRLHTGETPFKCPVCDRGYAQRCNMKSHIRIHRISELNPQLLLKIKPNYLRLMKA